LKKKNLGVFSLIGTELSDLIVIKHKLMGPTGKCCHTQVRQHLSPLMAFSLSSSTLFLSTVLSFFLLQPGHSTHFMWFSWNSWPQLGLSH